MEAYCYTSNEPPPPTNQRATTSKRRLDDTPPANKAQRTGGSSTRSSVDELDDSALTASEHAQVAVDKIASSLGQVQKYIDDSKKHAIEHICRTSNGPNIDWQDLLTILPPLDEFRQIIHCFFTEVSNF
jgi:hypothetical protein